ncbi:MAG: hypothetical protein AAFP20_25555 [Cyanobacteria bacterium J06614_10]
MAATTLALKKMDEALLAKKEVVDIVERRVFGAVGLVLERRKTALHASPAQIVVVVEDLLKVHTTGLQT